MADKTVWTDKDETTERLDAFRKELKEYVEQLGYAKPVQQAVADACLAKFDKHFPEIKQGKNLRYPKAEAANARMEHIIREIYEEG